MSIETRDALRKNVVETLLNTFPGSKQVVGGVAYLSNVVDEETGMLFPVEIKATVKNTKDTNRSKAYDFDAEVEKFENRPGRRVADPAKRAEREAAAKASAERKAANVAILRDWVLSQLPAEGMIPSAIAAAIPEFDGLTPMQVGSYLKALADEGVITYTLDEKRHKVYTLA